MYSFCSFGCFVVLLFSLELQARYFASFLSGEVDLPSKKDMYKDEGQDLSFWTKRGKEPSHAVTISSLNYCDQLAEKISHLPSVLDQESFEKAKDFLFGPGRTSYWSRKYKY